MPCYCTGIVFILICRTEPQQMPATNYTKPSHFELFLLVRHAVNGLKHTIAFNSYNNM